MPNVTYIDQYINDGNKETLSMRNLYDHILISNENKDDIFRVPWNDFFLKHKNELDQILMWYSISNNALYKPKAVSLTLYGTTELWLGLLRANNMRSIADFNKTLIKVYSPNLLPELIKTFFKREGKA